PHPPPDSSLSLHDALPIYAMCAGAVPLEGAPGFGDLPFHGAAVERSLGQLEDEARPGRVDEAIVLVVVLRHRRHPDPGVGAALQDRKSTRLNSSHLVISYA